MGRDARPASGGAQLRQQVEDTHNLRAIANHLPIAYLPPAQPTIPINHKGRAPSHVTRFIEDAVGAHDGAVDVAQQREREPLRLIVGSMRKRTVGADRQNRRAALPDLGIDLDQAGELGCSDPAPVVAIEHQHHVLSSECRERDIGPRGGRQGKIRRGLTEV